MTTLSKEYGGHAAPLESEDEKSPLLTLEDGIAPTLPILRPLGYGACELAIGVYRFQALCSCVSSFPGDVPNAVRTSYNAILDDALTRYLDVSSLPAVVIFSHSQYKPLLSGC